MKRKNLFIPEPLIKALQALAKKTDVNFSEHVRRAIELYLKHVNDEGKAK